MSERDTVAVVIVNYNTGQALLTALASLKAQTVPPSRVIVIDNASESFDADRVKNAYPGVEVVQSEKNIGFAAANNLGAKMADDCRWLALVNPDAYPEPDWLARLLAAAGSNPEYTCFGGRTMNAKRPEALDGAGDVYHVSGKVWRRGIGQNISRVSYETGEIFSPCAAAAMYLRSAFLEAGGFDESFFCYMEDVDLGFRLRLAGHKCLFVYDAVARHEGSASSGLHSDFYVYHGARNMVWTFMKNMPAPLLIMYLPQHLLLNLFTMLWYALQGKGGAVVRAKRDSIAGLPRVLEQRKRLHKRRAAGALALRKVMAKGPLKPYLSQIRRERLKNAD